MYSLGVLCGYVVINRLCKLGIVFGVCKVIVFYPKLIKCKLMNGYGMVQVQNCLGS